MIARSHKAARVCVRACVWAARGRQKHDDDERDEHEDAIDGSRARYFRGPN